MRTRLPAAMATAAAAALLLSGCSVFSAITGAETRDETGTIVDGGTTDVFALQVGDCIVSSVGSDEVVEVPTVPCAEPHDAEVYAELTLADGDYPGEDAIFAQGDDGCSDAFTGFVGQSAESSTLDFTYYYPTAASWAQGDRLITCIIDDPTGQTTGSLEGAAR